MSPKIPLEGRNETQYKCKKNNLPRSYINIIALFDKLGGIIKSGH